MSWKEDILREFGISLKQDYPELTYILIFYFSLRDFFNPKTHTYATNSTDDTVQQLQ